MGYSLGSFMEVSFELNLREAPYIPLGKSFEGGVTGNVTYIGDMLR